MVIIWMDIWDAQSGQNAKSLINRCFNIGIYIVTIYSANMNSGVPQCKKLLEIGYTTFACQIQGLKCIECNSPHKSEISDISYGVAKQISKSTHPDLKQNIGNCVLTCLNALTAKAIIKLTPICALSGSINLIESST